MWPILIMVTSFMTSQLIKHLPTNLKLYIQYNAALAITRTIQGTSRIEIYQELGLESPKHRRQFSENITTYCCRTDLQTFFFPKDYC